MHQCTRIDRCNSKYNWKLEILHTLHDVLHFCDIFISLASRNFHCELLLTKSSHPLITAEDHAINNKTCCSKCTILTSFAACPLLLYNYMLILQGKY